MPIGYPRECRVLLEKTRREQMGYINWNISYRIRWYLRRLVGEPTPPKLDYIQRELLREEFIRRGREWIEELNDVLFRCCHLLAKRKNSDPCDKVLILVWRYGAFLCPTLLKNIMDLLESRQYHLVIDVLSRVDEEMDKLMEKGLCKARWIR